MKLLHRYITTIFLCSALQSCSVYMAAAGKQEPNLGAFNLGSFRGQVEQQLGSPISSSTLADGERDDVYEYVLGNEPSPGRAMAHGAADLLTLGIWEVIGTPIEAGSQGTKRQIRIRYDREDRVKVIN